MSDRTAAIRDITEALERAEKMRDSLDAAVSSLWGVENDLGFVIDRIRGTNSDAILTMRMALRCLKAPGSDND